MKRNLLSPNLRLALAQINSTVGDIQYNTQKIITNIKLAKENGADIIIFPELAITGYPPEDLLLKQSFVEENISAIHTIAAHTVGITAVVGFVAIENDIYNAAAVLHDGSFAGASYKTFLPNYGVFDEDRYFQAATDIKVFTIGDVTFGVEICEDLWYAEGPHSQQALVGGAQLIVDINSSPYHAGKWKSRERMLSARALDNACAIAYVNMVGGQDELVFDGNSLVMGADGEVLFRSCAFNEQLAFVDLDLSPIEHQRLVDPRRRKAKLGIGQTSSVEQIVLPRLPKTDKLMQVSETCEEMGAVEEIYNALVVGTRDYVNKNGFKEVILGLSGGIDSALVACIAVDALGSDRVRVLVMPSEFSSNETQSDAVTMAKKLGIKYDWVPIGDLFETYKETLSDLFSGTQSGVAEENLQARIRGNLLMALSNKFGCLVLTTGNKSEMACGYSTLYGDMAGGFMVIKDVPKILVYKLSEYRNSISEDIPTTIITRPPSAELRPDQKDQDTLPPYEMLDPIIEAYVEDDKSIVEIVEMGFEESIVRRVVGMIDRNEYKRRQAAPGIKITQKAFGRDRRLPITNKYKE